MDSNKEIERLQEELSDCKRRLEFLLAAINRLPNPIFMKDKEAKFFFFNKAYSEFFDMKRSEYIGKTVLDLDYLPMDEREQFQKEDLRLIEESDTVSYDAVFTTSDGVEHPSFYWSCGFFDESTNSQGLVGEIVDISKERLLQQSLDDSLDELKTVNDKLKVMAETDPGSGLYNRTIMWDKGVELLERSGVDESSSCLLMFDLDNFKGINDAFGHLEGDEILTKFAEILKSECRPNDLPIRYGGDEFLLMLQNIGFENAKKVAERIRCRAENELELPDGSSETVSVGVIELDDSVDFEKNLSLLDDYLYKAKALGRNNVVSEL